MFKAIFVANLRVKLMAMAMAIALWFFAINRYTEEITEVVDVEIIVPQEFTLLKQSTNNVIIKLIGPQEVVDGISNLITDNKIKARCQISVGEIDEKEDTVRKSLMITNENLNLPDDIRLESVFPDKVEVVLSRLEKKYLSVRLKKNGQPAPGFTIKNEFIYPGEVEVEGPADILKSISHIYTDVIDIGGITSEKNKTFPWIIDLEQSVRIVQDEANIDIPVKTEEQVRVWFSVSELHDVKTLQKVKVVLLQPTNFPYQVTLQDENIDLTVNGPKMVVDKLTSDDIIAYVDVRSLKPPGPYKQPVLVDLPNGVEVEDEIPVIHVDLNDNEVAPE